MVADSVHDSHDNGIYGAVGWFALPAQLGERGGCRRVAGNDYQLRPDASILRAVVLVGRGNARNRSALSTHDLALGG